jgi:hypothetical protein
MTNPTKMAYYLATMDVPHDTMVERVFSAMRNAGIHALDAFDGHFEAQPPRFFPPQLIEEIFTAHPELFTISFFGDGSYHTMTKEEIGL